MKNKRLIEITLLLSGTFTMMAGAIIAPSLPQITRIFADIENIALLTRMVLSLPAIFTALFAPVFGLLADKMGRKNLLLASFLLYALSGASAYLFHDIYVILVGRAFLGIAVAGIMTLSSTLIGDYYSGSQRSKFLGLQGAFMGFGGVVFISLAGVFADMRWDYPFLIYLMVLGVFLSGSISLYEPAKNPSNKGEQISGNGFVLSSLGIYLLVFIGIVFFYMMPVQLPFLLDNLANMTNAKIGMAIATMNLSAAIVSLFYKWIKSKFSYYSIYLLVLLFMGCGYYIIAQGISYGLIVLGGIVAGMGIGMLMPLGNLWIMDKAPANKRARMVSHVTTAVYLGQFLSPVLLQSIVDLFGIRALFYGSSYGLILFALLLFIIKISRKMQIKRHHAYR